MFNSNNNNNNKNNNNNNTNNNVPYLTSIYITNLYNRFIILAILINY